ncbi:MAG: hypothetical protein LBJ17_01760 [Dysgonamonadaceae bacterium]|jgi:hypothetical protein|nr:hypothetical protein [Dysgonamonadaceae bacterium]
MAKKDYVPEREDDFYIWSINFKKHLAAYVDRGVIPPGIYEEIVEKGERYETYYVRTNNLDTRTRVTIVGRRGARKAYEKLIRETVREYLANNHTLTDLEKISIGLNIPKAGRTPAPVATTAPSVEIGISRLAHLKIHVYENGHSNRRGKPDGQHCAELAWIHSPVKPKSWNDLTHTIVSTKSPFKLEFEDDMRGETIWFAVRWENTRGQKGPWSAMIDAIIP